MKRVFSVPERTHGQGGIKFSWQRKQGNYLTTTGADKKVKLFDRHGDQKFDVILPGACVCMDWDCDGDILAVACEQSSIFFLWDSLTHKTTPVDSGVKDNLTFLLWSKTAPLLAIGTFKGNLVIYNHQTGRKASMMGKHTKKITCGAWSQGSMLALGSEDRTLTISNPEGDTLHQAPFQGEPSNLQFCEMKREERSTSRENTVTVNVGRESLFFFNMDDPENPIELSFQQRYGSIVSYEWFGDGYILIGFANGYFIVISTHMKEIGQELFQARNHKNRLNDIAISISLGKAASAGDNCIKIHDLTEFKDMYAIITLDDERTLDRMAWSDDGQLLAVSTPKGSLHVYLAKLPMLHATCQTRVAHLTSLLEVTVQDSVLGEKPVTIATEVEPSFVGVGPSHVALGMNNSAWFYSLGDDGPEKKETREYLGTVETMHINKTYAAVSFDKKVLLHLIESNENVSEDRESRLFPGPDSDTKITCHVLTPEFLVFSTQSGSIHFFYVEDWQFVAEHRHMVGIRKIFPDSTGTRILFIDEKSDGYVLNPVSDTVVSIPNFSPTAQGVVWEQWAEGKGVFIAYDLDKIYTFVYSREAITPSKAVDASRSMASRTQTEAESVDSNNYSKVVFAGVSRRPYGQVPVLLYNGEVTLQTQSGQLSTTLLDSHAHIFQDSPLTLAPNQLQVALEQCIRLRRFEDGWLYCSELNNPKTWRMLGKVALYSINLPMAVRVYRELGDVGMVSSLVKIMDIEDRNLLMGYLAMFLGEFNQAQDFFLASGTPTAALEMRRDLLQWDSALQLAKALSPDQIPFISKEYGQQLEFTGDFVSALKHFENGVTKDAKEREHDEMCACGIARLSIRMGDIRKGITMAMKMPNKTLKKDCAMILESMKQWTEAAKLFEQGQFYDKAALVYIKGKNWGKVGDLLPKISSPKIHSQYAKAKEADGRFKEAAEAYRGAREWDSVIRLNLEFLNNPEEAVRIVQETKSVEGAKLVAKFFQKLNDYASAIQFLVLSRCNDEAFQLAQSHGQMEAYADIVGSDATAEDYQSIAVHFENEKRHMLAGKFFLLSGQYARAMKHLLRCSAGDSQAIELAIETVGRANDDSLTAQLIEFLMGDSDGSPKEAKYLFRLYMALKRFPDAARTAVIIAREEQDAGNYRSAHDVLFSMYQELKANRIKVPSEMATNLLLLHSYILVKIHVKKGDHLKGARMLIRVANNISKFPSHIVPILTSTVIECHRANLKNSSFSFAAMLMRPEYRNNIDAKYKKKIEMIVRKPDKAEEEEPLTPCPVCSFQLAETELMCPGCKNQLPYCLVTGRHVVREDLAACPGCDFPAIQSEFVRLLETEGMCPMCNEKVTKDKVQKATDPEKYIRPEEGVALVTKETEASD
ncbi:hypothetical protein ACOMHN_048952 [Nucella lapillus]